MGNVGPVENFLVRIPVCMCWIEPRHHASGCCTSIICKCGDSSGSNDRWICRKGGNFHKAVDHRKREEHAAAYNEKEQPNKEDGLPSCWASTNSGGSRGDKCRLRCTKRPDGWIW